MWKCCDFVIPFLRNMCGERNPSNTDHSHGVSLIPSDLITEILLRLPVASLVRFRCVCKQWNSIISDTHFAKLHLSRSTMDSTLNHHHFLLLNQTASGSQFLSCSVKSLFNNPCTRLEDLTCRFRPDDHRYHIILGTCNGVVCLYDAEKNHLLLWNPSIRLTSRKYPLLSCTADRTTMYYYGFGYDHVSNQFKAVLVFRDRSPQDVRRTVTKVYAFGDSRCTSIQNLNYLGYPKNGSGIFVGGNLNWVALIKGADVPSHVIRSFNLEKETFGELSLPNFSPYNPVNPMQAVLKNCLSVCYDWKGTHLVVWLMKEYGVKESWTKLMAIPHVEPQTFGFYPYIEPLCMSENDQVLLNSISNRVRTIINNLKDGRLEYPPFQSDVYWYTQHIYLESLVSPCF